VLVYQNHAPKIKETKSSAVFLINNFFYLLILNALEEKRSRSRHLKAQNKREAQRRKLEAKFTAA